MVADIDEFLYFPLNRNLKDILIYLNENKYNTVPVQMLDMFSKDDVKVKEDKEEWTSEHLRSTYRYYDLQNITEKQYIRSLLLSLIHI